MNSKTIISDTELVQTALSAVLEESRRRGLDINFVLIGGSFAESLAASGSDIDFVIVHGGERASGALALAVAGVRVEATLFTLGEYCRITGMQRQGGAGSSSFWQLVSRRRLLFAKPVYGHAAHGEQLKKSRFQDFLDDLLDFQQSLALKSFSDVKAGLSDSLGEDEIRVRCRIHLEHSVDLLLSARGDYYFREKYRIARLRRSLKDARIRLLLEPISCLVSGRIMSAKNQSLDEWKGSVYAHAILCQYLAAFSSFWPKFLTAADVGNFLKCPALSRPVCVFWQGGKIICQSSSAAFVLSPAIANSVVLSLFGLSADRVAEGSESYARHEFGRQWADRPASTEAYRLLPEILSRLCA